MKQVLSFGVGLLLCSSAFADIIYLNQTIDLQGTGVGVTNPIIRLQSPGASSIETGCVAPNGSGGQTNADCGFADSSVQQSNLIALDSLNLANASGFRVVFNGIEPEGNNQQGITIDALEIALYSADGVAVETFALQSPVAIPDAIQGQGQAGFLFGLDDDQTALLQARLGGGFLVGGGGQFSNAQGGPDSIFLFNAGGSQEDPVVPEPMTMTLMGGGLLAIALYSKRRNQKVQ